MGLDVARVVGTVDEELLCPICSGVLECPLAAPDCEHAFCASCITQWLNLASSGPGSTSSCPVDRAPLRPEQLRPAPRILRNLLSRLDVRCENEPHGCAAVVKMDMLSSHLKDCAHNPKRPTECSEGCGMTVPRDELAAHNCIRELRAGLKAHDQKVAELLQEINDCKYQMAEQRREISILKDLMRGLRIPCAASGNAQSSGVAPPSGAGASPRTVTNQIQDYEVARWAATLTRAKVTRWGGMISTPDAVLQTLIRRSLVETGCPDHIVDELMANAHERRWPPGLLSLETRQINRRQYEQYVCRRIPNKQAVAVMACDNMHMSDDMILQPGLGKQNTFEFQTAAKL